MNNKRSYGPMLVFFGAVFWSLNAPLVKFITLDPLLLAGLRSLIAGIVLAPFISIKKLNFNRWIVLFIISYTGLCISIILALSMTSATIAIGMQYAGIIWIFLLGLIKKDKTSKKSFIPVFLILIGIILFMLSSNGKGNLTGNLIALTESIFFAGITISTKKSNTKNPLGLISIGNLFTAFFVFIFLSPTFKQVIYISHQSWILVLILGIVQIALGYSFYTIGLQTVSAQKASIIAIWEMILGPLWVAIFLKEFPNTLVLIGFLLILSGMVIDGLLNLNLKTIWVEKHKNRDGCK